MLHIKHTQHSFIRYFFSSQFGGFLVHCLNGLCILLSNDLALHLQSGRQRVGEGAEVFREDCEFLGEKGRRGEALLAIIYKPYTCNCLWQNNVPWQVSLPTSNLQIANMKETSAQSAEV